jgi:hypothetical protein
VPLQFQTGFVDRSTKIRGEPVGEAVLLQPSRESGQIVLIAQ